MQKKEKRRGGEKWTQRTKRNHLFEVTLRPNPISLLPQPPFHHKEKEKRSKGEEEIISKSVSEGL